MDSPLSPLVMIMVAFPVVGLLWLATGSLRATRRRLYKSVLTGLALLCPVGALVGMGLKVPTALIDWLVSFGFAFALLLYGSRAQDARAQEDARLADIDEMLKQMRDGTM